MLMLLATGTFTISQPLPIPAKNPAMDSGSPIVADNPIL
jgi:hypothetical protein